MPNLSKKLMCMVAILISMPALGADVPPPDAGQKSKLEFFRDREKMALFTARVDVNGRRASEISKGETSAVLIEPGRTIVTIDAALSPGQLKFSFNAEKGAEYRFEVYENINKMDAEHLFGVPPKATNGELLESSGVLKASLISANLPKPVEPAPAKTEPVPDPAPVSAVKTSFTVEDKLRVLKHLFEQDLISKEAYQEKQQKILEELR